MKSNTCFLTLVFLLLSCFPTYSKNADYLRVVDGEFVSDGQPYRYVGTNFWYGAILGSEGRGGNRERLHKELDLMQEIGIDNVRVLVGGDGEENQPSHIMPVLQTAPGVYNDTILDGLDYLMAELEKRDMKAVLFLNNAWEWSGGYGTYLDWAGESKTPNPAIDGYDKYMSHVAKFVKNDKAKKMAADHVKYIVGRTNRYTGKPYTESPAIMSWQIANEPRAFAGDEATKAAFADWISSQAALIKSLDGNHMVSTGSEGSHGCEADIELWEKIHSDPNIDYAIIHMWPYNWGWVNEKDLTENVGTACKNAYNYIAGHSNKARKMGKPLVIEEFGYPRDGFVFTPGSSTKGRDRFYEYIFSLVANDDNINGCNFWGWGGYADPQHESWQAWDDYTGDPAQEAQGLNSVFAKDKSTVEVIKKANKRIREKKGKEKLPYQNAQLPIEERVNDLLGRMTLEEKVGQMNQLVGIEHFRSNMETMTEDELHNNTANAFYPGYTIEGMENLTAAGGVGSFLHVLNMEEANYLQSLAMNSRLGIPIIFGIDAIHGNAMCRDNTVYPTTIGISGTFNPELAEEIARQTAREMRSMNMHWTFSPNVEVARDARWGRCGETFGEDPYLVGRMGEAFVRGYQGDLGEENVIACVKHIIGGSQSVNGTNGAPCDVSERTLREIFFPPFAASTGAGALSAMMSHNELNGVPCHTNRWLMEDILRGEWGFNGFIVSDWDDLEHVYDLHGTAESVKDAYKQAILAGMDMHMHGPAWNDAVVELVKEGKLPMESVDKAVKRILEVKFRLGLFENPFSDPVASSSKRMTAEHRATALDASRQSIVLLKNKDNILPLQAAKYKKVAVTGINADDENLMGDWSAQQPEENVITILEGLKMISPETEFVFTDQGWDPRNMDPGKVDEAVKAAETADLNIVVAGEYMMRWRWRERTGGEDTDRSDVDLVGLQNELIERIVATGKPTVLILINGRPLSTEWADDNVDAIVEAWEPGMYGGQAVAEILYGKVNPSGKLTMTIPRSVGQTPVVYNHKPSTYFHPTVVKNPTPLYPFG